MPIEAWLRGPVDGVPALLVPVAHMLQHAHEDAVTAMTDLTPEQIWARPGGGASIGFHVRHLMGALDRLFTYARGEGLTTDQLRALKAEGAAGDPPADVPALIAELAAATARALDQLRATDPLTLLEPRAVGRQLLPSTILGLLVHGGEHSARHAGQALTLRRVVRSAEVPES
jgi:DinB superfamily